MLTYRLREENEQLLHDISLSERRMRMLLGSIPGMAYRSYTGDDWKTLLASDGFSELFGYTADEFVEGKILYNELVEPDFMEELRIEVDQAIAEKREFETQYIITTKEGVKKWVLERGQIVETDENGFHILEGFVTDISERKKTEMELDSALKKIEELEKSK
ncbi:MAG: PAS domain S-box-containing protein [Arenicella sp.]